MKKELEKVVSRPIDPITCEILFKASTAELKNYLGIGFSDTICKYDGKTTDIFRLKSDLKKVKEATLSFVKTKRFQNNIKKYRTIAHFYRRAIKECRPLDEIIDYATKLYAVLIVSYYLTNYWVNEIPLFIRKKVLKIGEKYRHITDGIIPEFEGYIKNYLISHGFSLFTTLDNLRGNKKDGPNLAKGFIFSKGKFFTIKWDRFLEEKGYFYKAEKLPETIEEIKGSTSCVGKVKGAAKLIFGPSDFNKFKKEDILVAPMTQANFMPIISRASAIVTDEGGITCHAAIVSRELKIPCIIGTKIATQVLKDGDLVEVDANKGIVKILKRS